MKKEKNLKIKTYKEWEGNLVDYLEIGDIVDEEMYMHFLNVLPPTTNYSYLLQVGEPYDHVNGKATYTTFEKVNGMWTYKGNCFRGEKTNVR